MLVFGTSDKGGTGRSVTMCNIAYRSALRGQDVCYLDFDFGSPTAGAIFDISDALRGTTEGGLHSYLNDRMSEPKRLDVWTQTERVSVRGRPSGAGRLVLLPGDTWGGEFPSSRDSVDRCMQLFLRLDEEFDLTMVDLSAGRSYATDLVLDATAQPHLHAVLSRWLVFHRWTRQHILAAAGLVYGERGILDVGVIRGLDRDALVDSVRFVRTAVVDPASPELAGLRAAQVVWLSTCNRELTELAVRTGIGRTTMLGSVPLDPLLQWREQLISDDDVLTSQVANAATVAAFDRLAERIVADEAWEGL